MRLVSVVTPVTEILENLGRYVLILDGVFAHQKLRTFRNLTPTWNRHYTYRIPTYYNTSLVIEPRGYIRKAA